MRSTVATFLVFMAASTAVGRPNIVLIMCDDLGYADVGFNGSTDIETPSIDRLATNGTILTSGYVVHPFCGPSRMGMMTGRYPHKIGAPFNLPETSKRVVEYDNEGVDVNETLISTVLQRVGYLTGAIGKWHMGAAPEYHPNNRGFDEYYGFLGGGHRYFPDQYRPIYEKQLAAGVNHIWDYLTPLEHNGREVDETEYITDALSREAVRFIKDAATKDQPFFLYLSYNAPHVPLEAKDKDMELFSHIPDKDRRTYAAMVYAIDRGVGQIEEALKSTGKFENTLIVFLSDNGGAVGLGANNEPLRGEKGDTYEGGYRVPMLFHWPGHVSAGEHYDHPVSTLDFYPTFAALADADIPGDKQLDGTNIWSDFQAGRSPRQGEMIFVLRHREGYSDVGAREDQWKICRTERTWKLFDLEQDIEEEHDLSAKYPDRLKEMVSKAHEWSRSHTEPRWFDSVGARDQWKENDMPKYEEAFAID